jgi:hypothetical protein
MDRRRYVDIVFSVSAGSVVLIDVSAEAAGVRC